MAALWSIRHKQSNLTILVHTKENAGLGSFMTALSSEVNYLHPEIYGLKKESNYAFLLSSSYAEMQIWRNSIESLCLSDFEFDKRHCDLNLKKEVRRMNKAAIVHWHLNLLDSIKPEKSNTDSLQSLFISWVN